MTARFVSQIENFGRTALQRLDTVQKNSLIALAEIASTPISEGGKMPVVSGALRDSIVGMSASGGRTGGAESYRGAIEGAPEFEPVSIGWTAPYASIVEYGGDGRSPAGFARDAAAQWVALVDTEARRARGVV